MQAQQSAEPVLGRPSSLRSGFAWTFAGNAVYAATQWAMLSLLAKLGGRTMLGEYALAVALTAPVAMLAHLNLRAVLATDVTGQRRFGDYLRVRFIASGIGLAAMAALALLFGGSAEMSGVILLAGLSLTSEAISDAYYGAMQRRDQMDRIARSMMARGILSATSFGLALWVWGGLLPAVAAVAAVRLALLIIWDRPAGAAGEQMSGASWAGTRSVLRQALPLGAVLMLVSLNTNLPRYVIEHRMGVAELGVFAAVASFVAAGSTIVNALGQSATPRLARFASLNQTREFLGLVRKLGLLVLGLGLAGVIGSALVGRFVLSIAYRPEYASYVGILVAVMGAAIPANLAAAMGYAVTAVRAFDAQVPLFIISALICGITSWALVPELGLAGAAAAMAIAAMAQIGGQAYILSRALRRLEAPQ
ncbi:MAG: lipopolysaccharide biosynthesis protein [Bryobacteraceae bacterium]|nr:lipopolysaccharide biosynthesis protein [Bryobacteraceae bacterium]